MPRTARPPIVAVMGHIDHGKSSLLDYIRKANVVAGEAGGITQHVSAYVALHEHEGKTRKITFLDTPGHEAFRALRARGAAAADIAILVIAADEGVKPQTKEAFDEIISAKLPFVIAFTKIDKNGADVERAKISAIENGIYIEGLGGDVPFTAVSSKTGVGVPELLDLVLLSADLAEPSADATQPASGFVLESSQDPRRGTTATLIIKDGTIETGTFIVAESCMTPVRFIENFLGARIPSAGPSEPVSISGWNALPPAGVVFMSFATKKEAEKAIAAKAAEGSSEGSPSKDMLREAGGKTLLPLIIKADVSGSIDGIKHELALVEAKHERITPRIIQTGVGAVSETDVKTAQAAGGIIIAFHTSVDSDARQLAERLMVPIESFDIIYDLGKRVDDLMKERAPKVRAEEELGRMKVLKSFSTSGAKQVLGARHLSGTLPLGAQVKITRRGIELATGKILNLQVARADVKEIHVEGEFGLQVESKTDIAPGDELVAFRIVES